MVWPLYWVSEIERGTSIILMTFILLFPSCSDGSRVEEMILKENGYLIFRSYDGKFSGAISNYNAGVTKVSHVGLLLFMHNQWTVSHFLDGPIQGLRLDSLEEFIDGNPDHVSIWKIEVENDGSYQEVLRYMEHHLKEKTQYDHHFLLNNDRLYCSEYVVEALQILNAKSFTFIPHRKLLSSMERAYFQRDTLIYYPVDIFQQHEDIKRILSIGNE